MIQEFPAIKETQVVMLRCDLYTGHVVDINMMLATQKEQNVWTVYDLIDNAINDAKLIVESYDHIECSLFDKDRKLIQLIQPS